MDADELKQLEDLWRDERERPGGTTAQAHVLELIAEVRARDEHIKFLLWSLMRPGVGLFENVAAPGEWYLLYNDAGGGITKEDVPAELAAVLNSPEGQSWSRSDG